MSHTPVVSFQMLFITAVLSHQFTPAALSQILPTLPQGNTGIAARYPGDSGIAKDPAVIFADDFESYANASGLSATWNGGVYHNVRIATESGNVFAGSKAVEFRCPSQSAELSNTVARDLAPAEELETLFLRYYTKFDPSFDVVDGRTCCAVPRSMRWFKQSFFHQRTVHIIHARPLNVRRNGTLFDPGENGAMLYQKNLSCGQAPNSMG